MVTKNEIKSALSALGVRPGELALVHSSLKAFGRVENGADTVIDALLEVLGPEGTLVLPTFTLSFQPLEKIIFDTVNSKSEVGIITEVFRRRPGVLRSTHLVHSVAASGLPLRKIKVLTDRYELLGNALGTSLALNGSDGVKNRGKIIYREMFALKLGKYALLGLPGEPFGDYSRMLRSRTIGKRLLTVEECNGYISYFPLKKDFPLGSYEVNSAVCDASSEKTILTTGLKTLRKIGF